MTPHQFVAALKRLGKRAAEALGVTVRQTFAVRPVTPKYRRRIPKLLECLPQVAAMAADAGARGIGMKDNRHYVLVRAQRVALSIPSIEFVVHAFLEQSATAFSCRASQKRHWRIGTAPCFAVQ
jgi:hypothetical protein